MTIIEVLLPDGGVRAHTTFERSNAAIAEEVARLFPDASHWRMSKNWHSVAGAEQPNTASAALQRAKPIVVVLALAILLTPVITWAASLDSGSAAVLDWFADASTAPAVEAGELTGDPAASAPAAETVNAVQDVHIVGIAEQSSDTSRTLRVKLRNDGAQTHRDVRLRATFYDIFGTELPLQEGSVSTVTLAPQEEGFVKVWANSQYGVGQYELEVLDPAP